MASAVSEPMPSATPIPGSLRAVRLVRAAVLVASGFAIAFSAPLHSQLEFDRWVLVASLALLGAATVLEYLVVRRTAKSWLIAVRAVIALAAAVTLVFAGSVVAVSALLAIWAAAVAVFALVGLALGAQPLGVAIPAALFGAALAVVILAARTDPVAVVGFFGAYAVIRGVFLGISAFDGPRARADDEHTSPDGRATAA